MSPAICRSPRRAPRGPPPGRSASWRTSAGRSIATSIRDSGWRRCSTASTRPGSTHQEDQHMATVVGVVFQPGGKVYSFDPGGLELRWDERVICQTARGREYGRVVETEREVPDESLMGPLKRVVRRAVPADEQVIEQNRVEAKRGMLLFRELTKHHGLELKPVSSEVTFDGSRITFAFSAEERPDTRGLQTDLGARLKRRVDLRQVGPREQGRLCGAVGLCG